MCQGGRQLSKLIKQAWQHLWVRIVFCFVIIIGAVLSRFGDAIFEFITSMENWRQSKLWLTYTIDRSALYIVGKVEISRFVLFILFLTSASGIGAIFYYCWTNSLKINWNNPESVVKKFRKGSWKNIVWEWSYSGYSMDYPRAICPFCSAKLEVVEHRIGSRFGKYFEIKCPNENKTFDYGKEYDSFEALKVAARQEMLRRIREKCRIMRFR